MIIDGTKKKKTNIESIDMTVNYFYLSFKELCALGSIKQKKQNNKEAKKDKIQKLIYY